MLAPPTENHIFFSYRHGSPWSEIARRFCLKLRNAADALSLDVFCDHESLDVGDTWAAEVEGALSSCTHFLALLCDEYWDSPQCRRELSAAAERRARSGTVRLLFVLAEPMRPQYLRLQRNGQVVGDIATAGDVHFLGPYDAARRLVSLSGLNQHDQSAKMEEMITALQRTLRPPGVIA